MKQLKKKIKRDGLQGIVDTIIKLLEQPVQTDDDKLHYAVLAEVVQMAQKKLLDVKVEYGLILSPAQALAIRLLAVDYLPDARTKHVGNLLHQISDEANKLYALWQH
jgi:hypothetical protein